MDWNGHMIDQKIASYLAQRIKAIPLCRTPQEDCTVWPRSRDRNYSVKTRYQLLGELENREAVSRSNSADLRNFWKGIWSLRIPNKIKHFGWRACTESLPTLANLYPCKVVSSPLCSNCERASEIAFHALWDFDKVLGCRGHRINKIRSQYLSAGSFADLVFFIRQQEENMELFLVVAWFIWSRRNKMHFDEQHPPPKKILDVAEALLADFHGNPKCRPDRKIALTQRWVPPADVMYKVNYDGAYFVDEEKAGIGVVVRNELGQVMGSLAEKIDMMSTVEVLEAMTARRAMLFMEELDLRHVVFEGDSELDVKASVGHCLDRSSIGHIIKDCVCGNACFLGISLLAYALISGGWVYEGVIYGGHVLAVLGWEVDLEGGNICFGLIERQLALMPKLEQLKLPHE
nr:uncharacterized protein LOC112012488 [Quercus suber]